MLKSIKLAKKRLNWHMIKNILKEKLENLQGKVIHKKTPKDEYHLHQQDALKHLNEMVQMQHEREDQNPYEKEPTTQE